jgi:tetratricopeptide (TPR) repeat protein
MEDEAAVLDSARRAFEARDWRAAETAYQRLTTSERLGAEGCYGLGIVKLAQGQREEARTLFVRAIERDRSHANALYYLGELGNTRAEAESFFSAALAANPKHVGANEKLKELRDANAATAQSPRVGLGVYEYLKQDPTALSQQSVRLIESLRMDRRLRAAAFIDEAVAITIGALVLLAALSFAIYGFTRLNGAGTVVRGPEPASPRPIVSAQSLKPLPLGSNVRIVLPGGPGPGPSAPLANPAAPFAFVAGVIAVLWLLTLGVLAAKIRGVRARFEDGRIYCTRGIFRKDLTTTDLWLVSNITLNRSLWNRMTGDGELRFYGSAGKTLQRLKGLAREPELDDIYQRLQDLKFALRANPVVKGIIQ